MKTKAQLRKESLNRSIELDSFSEQHIEEYVEKRMETDHEFIDDNGTDYFKWARSLREDFIVWLCERLNYDDEPFED